MIWLYRRPILDYWAEHDETLGAIVKHVLVHEIGHHFGLSDADMAAIEQTGRLIVRVRVVVLCWCHHVSNGEARPC